MNGGDAPVNVKRYYKFLSEQPVFSSVMKKIPQVQVKAGKEKKTETSVSCYHCNLSINKIFNFLDRVVTKEKNLCKSSFRQVSTGTNVV